MPVPYSTLCTTQAQHFVMWLTVQPQMAVMIIFVVYESIVYMDPQLMSRSLLKEQCHICSVANFVMLSCQWSMHKVSITFTSESSGREQRNLLQHTSQDTIYDSTFLVFL